MWDRVDALLERAPHEEAVRMHRVELLEARRRRAAGLELGTLAIDEATAVMCELVTEPLLARVRDAWDGPLVVHKGPEVALDYPGPRLRCYWDLDLLTDDAARLQAALLAAGFETIDEEVSDHHLQPLGWPGLPLAIEVHSRPNWAERLPGPTADELLATSIPSRLGVEGLATLAPAQNTLVLASHAWSHDELGRLGNLIDVAVSLQHVDEADVAKLAQRWGCHRMWRTTRTAIRVLLEGDGRSAAVAVWARHLRGVRERSVAEWHIKNVLAPIWGLPGRRIPAAGVAEVLATTAADQHEPWPTKARRARLAVRNAGTARSEHLVALEREA